MAEGAIEPARMQDWETAVPELLALKNRMGFALRFHVRLEVDGGAAPLSEEAIAQINRLLEEFGDGFRV